MAKFTFDGATLTIQLLSGVTDVNVKEDLYSGWKEWVQIGDNAKYLPAFRTIGGEPLGSGFFSGDYYFLQNQLGWRIKYPEEDLEIVFSGNLFPEDANLDMFESPQSNYTIVSNIQTQTQVSLS